MSSPERITSRFFGYPAPKEGPNVPLVRKEDKNPVFRGWLLVVCAWLVSHVEFVQFSLWKNARFNGLRGLSALDEYTPRWDPTVIPLPQSDDASDPQKEEVQDVKVNLDDLPARYRTVAEYHALYRSGKLTPLAVAQSLLPLIRRDTTPAGPHSVAFTHSHPEEILEAARQSTLRYKAGKPLSILDGVPTGVKDDSNVKGYRSTKGRKRNDTLFQVAEESTWPVQKWQAAGVIIMGKLNMHEVGADTTNNNPNWGTPRNPHNSQYYPGGSSGGPAYAVSSGLIPFALGSDGGGSIRIPSSFCGIYGLKPSHNRTQDIGSTVTVNGPLGATMSDVEIAYRIMAQPNPSDPTCASFAPPRPLKSSRPKTLGIYKEWFDRAEPSVRTLCQKFVTYCETSLGYTIVPITIPYCPEAQTAHAMTILAEMATRARTEPSSTSNWLSGFNPANKVLLSVGAQTPTRDYILAQKLRHLIMQHLAFLFQKHPGLIIVTPTTPLPGWEIEHEGDLVHGVTDGNKSIRNMEYVWMANFTGLPGISCPVGYAEEKKGVGRVPVGIMGSAEWGGEEVLIEWGKEAEKWLGEEKEGGGRKIPGNWVDVFGLAGETMEKGGEE
ncbi:n-acylethanolamine amidohydrolase protein [Rutstroemia sp. NJR-2017a BBW]|nr:n-acylethanolamine amidohydrolase protein [Rutstroemia sp. NJR-2017a BBW]